MRPALRAAALAALVPGLLGVTWRRTTDQACGTCAYWATSPKYVVNASARASPQDCTDAIAAVQASFATWNGVCTTGTTPQLCTDLALTFGGTSPSHAVGIDGTNLVVFRKGPCDAIVTSADPCWNDETCGNRYNCWDTGVSGAGTSPHSDLMLALTWVAYQPRSGQILDADMELNDWGGTPGGISGDGWYLTCTAAVGAAYPPSNLCPAYGQGSCIYADLPSTVTHEAGHFIGLAHPDRLPDGSPDPTCDAACRAAVMYSQAKIGDSSKRTLTQGDITGVATIYPAGQPPLACPLVPTPACPRPTTGCSCGTGAGGAGALALLALLAAVPRRRRRA